MNQSLAQTGQCGFDTNPALGTCHRCGTFFCEACLRRTRPEATPMCKRCWDSRAKVVPEIENHSETRLQTAGLILGCISLLPLPAIQLASVAVNIVGLVKAKEGKAHEQRWKNKVGIALSCAGFLFFVLLMVFFADR